jgi:hypothetical protein
VSFTSWEFKCLCKANHATNWKVAGSIPDEVNF